jgi:hypothetical protein
MNKQELQKLISELQNGNAQQRRAASYKLGKSKELAAVPALINAYNDSDGSVRQNVIGGLRNISSPEALDFLNSQVVSPSTATEVISTDGEEMPETEEITILEIKQHKGMLVLVALLIPILIAASALTWKGVEEGSALGCFWFIGFGITIICIFSIPYYLAKRPELKVTNKRIVGYNTGATKEGLITQVEKVTVQDLVHFGNNHFGNLILKFKDKPTMWLGGLPDPINFVEKLKSIGVPANKIKIDYWQTRVLLILLLPYGFALFLLFFALSNR